VRLSEGQILEIIGKDFYACTGGTEDGRVYFSSKLDKQSPAYSTAMKRAVTKLSKHNLYARFLNWQSSSDAFVQGLQENWFVFLWFGGGAGYCVELRRGNNTGGFDISERVQSDIREYKEANELAISQIDLGKANYLIRKL
jgi:hypothetical protein